MPINQETFMYLTSIEDIDKSKLFISKDDHAFDVDELKDYFQKLGGVWLNPYTKAPFDEEDRKKLISHPEFSPVGRSTVE